MLFEQQDLLKKGNTETENTIASYEVSLLLAKNCKPFSDGKIIKESLEIVFKNICPKKLKILNNISLSRQTITRRTCDIADDLTIDESTDILQTAQLAIYIRGIDNDFLVTEELLDIYPMQGRTTGEDIFLAMKKVFKKFNLTYNRLISITSDSGGSMIGKKMGVVSRLENEMAENNLSLIKLHCIIHKQNLTAKTMDVENVMSVVVKAINSIKSSALQSRQFEAFLAENDSEYGGLLYCTKVRWLSRDYPPELEENEFVEKFAFLVDLTQLYNILIKELQGKDQLIGKMFILAFQLKLTLWEQQLRTGNFSHFPT
ncbi:general transcription factor II-I repeat domain-containing protein 2-like [Hydra vulgaris]|uniref:General transcription factor II-I repeat domain-containing protein 2-like n=1 Tax=Hydra vulgaris TaxID=6087 RepID=A0ABM4CU41_HYDVU